MLATNKIVKSSANSLPTRCRDDKNLFNVDDRQERGRMQDSARFKAELALLPLWYFGTSADTQQWAQPVTAGVHGVSSKKCRLDVVE